MPEMCSTSAPLTWLGRVISPRIARRSGLLLVSPEGRRRRMSHARRLVASVDAAAVRPDGTVLGALQGMRRTITGTRGWVDAASRRSGSNTAPSEATESAEEHAAGLVVNEMARSSDVRAATLAHNR